MKENHKIIKFQSGNIDTETYIDGDTYVTKHYHNAKDAYVRELIYVTDGITKIKHTNINGVVSKIEHFKDTKREGKETKFFISKANGTIKSTKLYESGKLHGENITFNESGNIIKHEVFAIGKVVLKYFRKSSQNNEITDVEIVNKQKVEELPKAEQDILRDIKIKLEIQN